MGWFVNFIDRLFIWLPRVLLIRATHGGVKWRSHLFSNYKPPSIIELKPGLHWFWPLTSECQLIVTARQTVDIPTMSLLTKDGVSVIVSAAVVFKINNVIAAIGRLNWDVDCTLVDVTQSVIFGAVRGKTLENLCKADESLLNDLSDECKQEVQKFGILVERVLLKDFDRSRTYRMLGQTVNFLESEPE